MPAQFEFVSLDVNLANNCHCVYGITFTFCGLCFISGCNKILLHIVAILVRLKQDGCTMMMDHKFY